MSVPQLIDFNHRRGVEEDSALYDAAPNKRGHLTMVHDDVLDTIGEKLGAAALAVYMVLERRANKSGACDPSYDTIAASLKISRRHVIEQVKALKKAGFILVESRRNTEQGFLTNTFSLPRHPNLIAFDPSAPPASTPSEVPSIIDTTLVHGVHPPSEDPSERPSESPAPPSAHPALPSEDPSEDPSAPPALKVNTSSYQVDIPTTSANESSTGRPPTTSMPFLLLEAMLDEQGAQVADLSKAEKDKQLGVTKRIAAAGITETDMRHIVRWMRGWKSGVDAISVEQKLTEWRMAGMPSEPTPFKKPEKKLAYNDPRNPNGFVG